MFVRASSNFAGYGSIGIAVVICIVCFASLPEIYRWATTVDRFASVRRSDPAIGSFCDLPPKDSYGISILTDGKFPVVVLGSCTSCSMSGFEPTKLHVPDDYPVVLIISDKASDVPESLTSLPRRFVIADPDRKFERILNTYWMPRMAILDGNKRIAWMQPRPNVYPDGVNYGP